MSVSAFAYVTAEKVRLYRLVMHAFTEAKGHFVVHLRPEDVAERIADKRGEVALEEVQAALAQLSAWGNLQAEPDTSRVTTVEDFYRARYLYQITREGEAAELALRTFEQVLGRRAALQAVALEEIRDTLHALLQEAGADPLDEMRVVLLLRNLATVFGDLAENARAFMAGLGRSIELRGGDREAFILYKRRVIDYLERFIRDLVTASGEIATLLERLDGEPVAQMLEVMAARDAADVAPDLAEEVLQPQAQYLENWRGHWAGLRGWFIGTADHPAQATILRSRARKAITQLMETVVRLNERRLGRSDRSADFRLLARWFLACETDGDAHRLWHTAFGLSPARHLTVDAETLSHRDLHPVSAATSWRDAPPLRISPRLRATGSYQKRGAPPKIRRRDTEKAYLARMLAEEAAQTRAARARLATGEPVRLSELGDLDRNAFVLFLRLLGEAISATGGPDQAVQTVTGDGSLAIELEPLADAGEAAILTPDGVFRGRDCLLRITDLEGA
jgi:uncharacterized protein (TIGR02677 family)